MPRARGQTLSASAKKYRRKWGWTRPLRARNMQRAGIVVQARGNTYVVPSQRVVGEEYTVYCGPDGRPVSCGKFTADGEVDIDDGCPDYYYRLNGRGRKCKHMILVALERPHAVQAATTRRSARLARVSSRAADRPTRASSRAADRPARVVVQVAVRRPVTRSRAGAARRATPSPRVTRSRARAAAAGAPRRSLRRTSARANLAEPRSAGAVALATQARLK